ncbi:hypothetical protein HanXRQr2_Chr13g0569991 [Helianthus annuus]|uniref:Uncharacterized protein n=1 Tax=Helianthus annuus TaxID=4232 RepID=A0A9K3EGG3_HELAN|nr:hypothetical protein HanXRQr2_Chr13g0569991 [Helianthus annuus]KAJ0847750.1 hypothetical protein HanPSC8_Chr13g0548851 [Helianthus annuus]
MYDFTVLAISMLFHGLPSSSVQLHIPVTYFFADISMMFKEVIKRNTSSFKMRSNASLTTSGSGEDAI